MSGGHYQYLHDQDWSGIRQSRMFRKLIGDLYYHRYEGFAETIREWRKDYLDDDGVGWMPEKESFEAEMRRKYGDRPVQVFMNRWDHTKMANYMARRDQGRSPGEQPDGPSVKLKIQASADFPKDSFIMKVEENPDSSERIEI